MEDGRAGGGPRMAWLTLVAIAALAVSLNVAFHEGVHAVSCLILDGELYEYSALHVDCQQTQAWQLKVQAGSASIGNLILGTACWIALRRWRGESSDSRFFLWLFMLMNWFYGAGYWMLSGIANIGDWAIVVDGWQPHWAWRVGMAMVGALLFLLFVWQGLQELGKFIGGRAPGQIRRAVSMGIVTYMTSAMVVLLAGFANSHGILGLPALAGIMAALGALSPLLWMPQWFRADIFVKEPGPLFLIRSSRGYVLAGAASALLYVGILGPGLAF